VSGDVGNYLSYGSIFSDSFAVEFDTRQDSQFSDPAAPHLGIDLAGSLNSSVTSSVISFANGITWWVWIDYVIANTTLLVRINNNSSRPANATIQGSVNLASLGMSSSVYMGFGAASSTYSEVVTVSNWQILVNHAKQYTLLDDSTAALTTYGSTSVLSSSGAVELLDYKSAVGNIFPTSPVTFYQSGQLQNISVYFTFSVTCPSGSGCADGFSFIVRFFLFFFFFLFFIIIIYYYFCSSDSTSFFQSMHF